MDSAEDSEDNWKEKLLRNYKRLVHDADLQETLDELFSEDVFTTEEKELVENVIPNTTHNKNRQLLKIMLQKTEEKYQIFLKSLEEIGHTDIAEQIKNTDIKKLLKSKGKNPQVINLRRKVFQNYHQIVGATSLSDLLDDFISKRIFELGDFERIVNVVPNTTDQKNRQFLDILLKKDCEDYDVFLELLVLQGHQKLVTKIKETIVDKTVDTEIEYHLSDKDDRDPLPRHIKEQFKMIVKKWEEEDAVFCETRATRRVMDAVQKHTTITVTANAGAGKTATIHHVALQLQQNGYSVFPVNGPEEILQFLRQGEKQVFVLDDPVGVHGLDRDILKNWLINNSKLETCICTENTKILSSIRKQVSIETDFKREDCILNKTTVDIQDEENKLNDEEKLDMIKQHLKVRQSDLKITQEAEMILKSTQELFPLICNIFASSTEFQHNGWDFFKNPFKLVLDDLDKLHRSEKLKYCVLVLCFAYENSLDPNIFDPFKDKKLRKKSKPFMKACGITSEVLLSSFTDTSESLTGIYLRKEGGMLKFSHDLMYDVVAFHFGSKHPEQVIEFSSSKFLCNRVVVSQEAASVYDSYVIVLPSDYYAKLAFRLIADLEEGIYNHVIMNKCWDDDNFMKTFCEIFNEIRKDSINRFFRGQYERRADILKLFYQSKHKQDEIEDELKQMEEESVNTWSRYYTSIKALRNPGITVLHWVVTFSHRALFNLIWENLSSKQKQKVTEVPLLHLACLSGDKEICKVLLKEEANKISSPFIQDGSVIGNELPLHYAACNSADIVELLIEHGANIDRKVFGRTALFNAAGLNNVETLRALVQHGADINACDDEGWTPLILACMDNSFECARILLQQTQCDVNHCQKDGWTALMFACESNNVECTKLLLDHGKCDINHKHIGWTPLMYAAKKNSVDCVNLLLKHNCDINLRNHDGETALMIAKKNKHKRVIDIFENQANQ